MWCNRTQLSKGKFVFRVFTSSHANLSWFYKTVGMVALQGETKSLPSCCGAALRTTRLKFCLIYHRILLDKASRFTVLSSSRPWRDDRVVEGARLESVCRGNSTEGSNPSLSASKVKERGPSPFYVSFFVTNN
ncbi:MAG: hypothetical protein JG781_2358 [Peptococcaceae bacterium]|nr:hypothetical protein [Peptococcaceae bacterium]